MTYEQINALLEKYWDGESSLDEERALKAYFASGQVDERLRNVAPLFAALRADSAVELQRNPAVPFAPGPAATWRRWAVAAASAALLVMAGWWWMSRPVDPVGLPPVAETPRPLTPEKAAPQAEQPATIAQETPQPEKPVAKRHRKPNVRPSGPAAIDPEAEQAMEEIKAALALVSSKINKGKREASKNLHEIETIDKIIKKPSAG